MGKRFSLHANLDEDCKALHQIVVPEIYHQGILSIAYDTRMSGHLGINNILKDSQPLLFA